MNALRLQLGLQKLFYDRLSGLGASHKPIRQQLQEILSTLVELSVARFGYLEIRNFAGKTLHQSFLVTDEEVKDVQNYFSTGIIAEAIKKGIPISTSTAFLDPRFNGMESVRLSNIEAVICAPFKGDKVEGVVYLQGDSEFKADSDKILLDAHLFADYVVPLLDQILLDNENENDADKAHLLRKKYRLNGIVGSSETSCNLLKTVCTIAPLDVSVLLTGDSGAGKTQLARVIHLNSKRSNCGFAEINCGAIPDTLIESELFGTSKGAFNSAQDRKGKIRAIDGGTLFLDEITELSLDAQAKFLQFLQSGEFFPIGSDTSVKTDVRIVFATNKSLEQLVQQGKFREDLYYRINVFPIAVPSLNARSSDIPELADHFCHLKCVKHGLKQLVLSDDFLQQCSTMNWPGNVRELENYIERACIQATIEQSEIVLPRHGLKRPNSTQPIDSDAVALSGDGSFQDATRDFQKSLFEKILAANEGNIANTAKRLQISKSHAYNLMNELGIDKAKKV